MSKPKKSRVRKILAPLAVFAAGYGAVKATLSLADRKKSHV